MLALMMMASVGVAGTTEPTDVRADWWAGKIGHHFVEEAAPGGVRLADGFAFGFVQGEIELPSDGRWLIHVPVLAQRARGGSVSIRINGEEIGLVDGAGGNVQLDASVRGDSFYYSFEYFAAPAASGTLIVSAGVAEALCAGDFNADGVTNVLDVIAFQRAFVAGEMDADLDANGSLDVLDFVQLQMAIRAGC